MLLVVATACGSDAETTTAPTTLSTPAAVPTGAQRAMVVAGGDAANLRVRFTDAGTSGAPGADIPVSLIGVEWPARGGCFAAESDAFAAEALPVGATVHLLADVQDAGPDGVLLRYAWDGTGELYNAKALRQGFAKAGSTAPNDRYRVELFAAEFEAKGAGRGVWGCPAESSPTTGKPATEGTTPATSTRPPATNPGPTVAPPETTVPGGRSVGKGQSFPIGVGETVSVAGEGLTVTYNQLVQDSRCPSGVQCIVAGDATIAVTLAKAGSAPATLSLNTDAPTTGQYLSYAVALVDLGSSASPPATLRVT